MLEVAYLVCVRDSGAAWTSVWRLMVAISSQKNHQQGDTSGLEENRLHLLSAIVLKQSSRILCR